MAEQTEQQEAQAELDIDSELEAMRQAETQSPDQEPEEQPQETAPEPEPATEPEIPTVPLGAFRELRDELKATRSREQELQGIVTGLNDRLSKFEESLNPPPNFEDDPLGNLQHQTTQKFDKLSGDIGELKEAISGNAEQTQALNLQTRIENAEKEFTQKHPDYPKAFKHIQDKRLAEYKILGVDESQWQQEAASYIQRAIQTGANPAQMVYELAKEMGYQSENPEPKSEEPKPSSLKEQAKKIQAAKSLSGASGSQPKGEIQDMEAGDIDNLDDDEFDKLFTGPDGEANWRKLHN